MTNALISRSLSFMIAVGLLAFAACGVEPQYENYNLSSEQDLVLTRSNHPHGYSQTQCFFCHVKSNIHQVDRINRPATVELARTLVEQSGLQSCNGCHGKNGAE